MNTSEKLLESWKKGQRHFEQFWKLCKNHYLLNLREKNQLLNKHPRVQAVKEPRIGDSSGKGFITYRNMANWTYHRDD